MDKFLSYTIIFVLGAFVIIGGNYFLTDDVGNFSMEKAKNLLPNIEMAFTEKKNEITGTRFQCGNSGLNCAVCAEEEDRDFGPRADAGRRLPGPAARWR